jgi:hypothetical protein
MVRLVTHIVAPLLRRGKGVSLSPGIDLPPKSRSTLEKLTFKRNSLLGELSTYCVQNYECYDQQRAKDFLRTSTCEFFDILMQAYGGLAWDREDEVADEAIGIAIACWDNFNVSPKGEFWINTLRVTVIQHLGRQLRKRETSAIPHEFAAPTAPIIQTPTAETPRLANDLKCLLDEARLRPEDIAEKIGIDPRNVYRHLSGETVPSLVNVDNYEKALSNRLGRKVKLPTPLKRKRVSKTSVIRQ